MSRSVSELREKWQEAKPFYYDLDHEGVGILFAEIKRLEGKLAGERRVSDSLRAALKTEPRDPRDPIAETSIVMESR